MERFKIVAIAVSLLMLTHCSFYNHLATSETGTPHPVQIVETTQTEHLAPFQNVVISGPFDVEIFANRMKSELEIMGNPDTTHHVTTEIKDGTLYITLFQHFSKHPVVAVISTPVIHTIRYKGSGTLRAIGLNSPMVSVSLKTDGSAYLAGNPLNLRTLKLAGRGPVVIRGIKSDDLRIETKSHNRVHLTGEAQLKHIRFSGTGWLSMYWINGPSLYIEGKDDAYLQLAGNVKVLDVKLHERAHFNGQYVRADKTYIKTFDHSRADIHTSKVQNTLASDQSNIYYYKTPKFRNDHVVFSGNILNLNGMS